MQDLIITTKKIKEEILLKRSKEGLIKNEKIMSLTDLKKMVYGELKSTAITKLMKEFSLSYNVAKVYSENLLFEGKKLKTYYDFCAKENLIERSKKEHFRSVTLINVLLDERCLEYFKGSKIISVKGNGDYKHSIHYFSSIEEEALWLCKCIINSEAPLEKIKIVELKSEYIKTVEKIFGMHNILINLKDEESVIRTSSFNQFYDKLCTTKSVLEAIKEVPKNDIYNKIISYFNTNSFDQIDEDALLVIYEDFKKIKLSKKKIKGAVECISLDDVFNEEYYYYFLGFNDQYPRVYKDEDFYSDEEKKELKLLTSLEKNKYSKESFLNLFNSTKNLVLSYSEKSTFLKYNESMFIKDNDIEVIKHEKTYSAYSNEYNKIYFAKMLDEFLKYGEKSKELSVLNNNYEIPFLEYSNKFTGLDKDKLNLPVTLSYSSVKTYFECAFKYYIEKVLKINSVESSLAINIGNIYHGVLSKMYNDDFNFSEEYDFEVNKCQLDKKNKFFIINLKDELVKIIEFLKEFNDHSCLNKNINESEFVIENVVNNKVHFKGFIDNIKYSDIYNLMILIDYKTGSVEASLDNINYGFNLQLPSYLYLVSEKMPDYKVVGTYLDKILDAPKIGDGEKELRNKLKFVGYSTTNTSDLEKLDSGYANSQYIRSLKLSSKGFYAYSKVLDEENFIKVKDLAKKKVLEAGENIVNADFSINPKEIENVVEKCKYCKYKDICFMRNEDVVYLENTKLMDAIK